MFYETGYFGIPGSTSKGKVHITEMRRPLCKSNMRKAAEFQMCANGVHLQIVECERCKLAWKNMKPNAPAHAPPEAVACSGLLDGNAEK